MIKSSSRSNSKNKLDTALYKSYISCLYCWKRRGQEKEFYINADGKVVCPPSSLVDQNPESDLPFLLFPSGWTNKSSIPSHVRLY